MPASPPSKRGKVLRLLLLLAGLALAEAFLLPLPPAKLYSVSHTTTAAPSPTQLSAATATSTTAEAAIDPETQRKLARDLFTIQERLNAGHRELMSQWVKAFCPIGDEISKANFWRGDAMTIATTECTRIGLDGLDLHVIVSEQGMFGGAKMRELDQTIKFNTNKKRTSPADLIRAMISMASAIGDEDSAACLYKIPVDDDKWVVSLSSIWEALEGKIAKSVVILDIAVDIEAASLHLYTLLFFSFPLYHSTFEGGYRVVSFEPRVPYIYTHLFFCSPFLASYTDPQQPLSQLCALEAIRPPVLL